MKIYLAVPYSFNPDFSKRIADKVAAQLMLEGKVLFSPISHSHELAKHMPEHFRTDSEWWMQHCLPWVDACDQLWVISIGEKGADLIEQSSGCIQELQRAMRKGKPVKQVEVNEHGDILNIV